MSLYTPLLLAALVSIGSCFTHNAQIIQIDITITIQSLTLWMTGILGVVIIAGIFYLIKILITYCYHRYTLPLADEMGYYINSMYSIIAYTDNFITDKKDWLANLDSRHSDINKNISVFANHTNQFVANMIYLLNDAKNRHNKTLSRHPLADRSTVVTNTPHEVAFIGRMHAIVDCLDVFLNQQKNYIANLKDDCWDLKELQSKGEQFVRNGRVFMCDVEKIMVWTRDFEDLV